MRAGKHTRRGPTHGVSGALLTTGVLTAALLATALLAASASAPAALTQVTTTRVTAPGSATPAGAHRTGGAAAASRWRVVQKIGPDNQGVAGTLTVHSASDAWSVWTGTRFTAVERLIGTSWTRVPLPARFTAYVRSAVAFDGDSASDFWLFSSYRTTRALHFTGTGWALAPIPSWVVRTQSGGGGLSVVSAAFGPGNVWVFSLDAGAYAAHYNGHSWTKVRLPGDPAEVSAVAANDIWALAGRVAMHWNGLRWITSKIPAAAGSPPEFFSNLTAAGPESAWVWRTIPTPAPGPATDAAVLHWDGTRWRRVAGTPADIINSVTPDGAGGLWAAGLDITPGGFNFFYHLTGGRWTQVSPPAGVWDQRSEYLAWIPGTRSLWGTAAGLSNAGNYGVLIKYGA